MESRFLFPYPTMPPTLPPVPSSSEKRQIFLCRRKTNGEMKTDCKERGQDRQKSRGKEEIGSSPRGRKKTHIGQRDRQSSSSDDCRFRVRQSSKSSPPKPRNAEGAKVCCESSEINENFQKKRSCPAKLRGVPSLSPAVRSHVQSRDSNDSHLGLATYFLANRIFYCSPRALIGNRLSRNAKTASGIFGSAAQ